jgi:hypothetical protein
MWHWVALPNIAYDTDDGLGLGAYAQVDRQEEGADPYRAAFVAHAFATTRGYHHHRFRFDLPEVAGHTRVMGHFAWRQWLNDGYWGMGNATLVDEDAGEKRYRYSLFQPFARLSARTDLGGPWSVFAFVVGRYSAIDTYDGSLLAEERPLGIDGGPGVQVGVGGSYDTRVPELAPSEGSMLELAVRGSPPGLDGAWIGVFASARSFASLGPRVVLAGRVMAEAQLGAVPFYDLVTWGGYEPTMGFGGSETLRGISYGRWRGPLKAIGNAELRVDVASPTVFKRDLRLQVVPLVDVGWVGGDVEEVGPIHPGAGLGLHAIYGGTVSGRVDAAMGVERYAVGSEVMERMVPGFYVVFDQAF